MQYFFIIMYACRWYPFFFQPSSLEVLWRPHGVGKLDSFRFGSPCRDTYVPKSNPMHKTPDITSRRWMVAGYLALPRNRYLCALFRPEFFDYASRPRPLVTISCPSPANEREIRQRQDEHLSPRVRLTFSPCVGSVWSQWPAHESAHAASTAILPSESWYYTRNNP